MHRARPQNPRRHRPHRIAIAASLLCGTCLPAAAQTTYYIWSGNLNPAPASALAPVFDANGPLYVATGAPGSFAALAGAQMTATTLSIGNGGNGSGDVTISGTNPGSGVRTTAVLGGAGNRLEVGNYGSGSLTVSAGALLDATATPANCGGSCYNVVGNAAGSTGTLTITGAGSELKTVGGFTLGSAYVDNAFNFGTPGGTTNATLNVLAGGTLRTQSTMLAGGPSGPSALGTEQSFATATVDGAASRWYITGTGSGGASANLNAGSTRSQATITLSNGGQLIVDATGEAGAGANFVNVGSNGGRGDLVVNSGGKLSLIGGTAADRSANLAVGGYGVGSQGFATVTGAGSEITVSGTNANLGVGAAGASGTLTVSNAGRVTSGGLTIGDKGGVGTVNVNGGFIDLNGSQGRLLIGNSGTGTLAVSGGGVVDATLNPAACVGNWCGNILANGAGSTGTLTIDGAGSVVRTLRSFQAGTTYVDAFTGTAGGVTTATIQITNGGKFVTGNTALGTPPSGSGALGTEKSFVDVLINGAGSQWTVTRNTVDNSAALMGIGLDAGATANVTVSGGGKLRIDGTGSPGPNDGINIGSNGKGTLIVTGAGSALETVGVGPFINIGANNAAGNGSFQLLAGATASSMFMNIGRNGGTGSMVLDGANTLLTLSGVETLPAGAGTATGSIGRNGGTGTVTVSNGARWLITDGGQDGRSINGSPALSVGRDANGHGSLTITGAGSRVEVVGNSINPAPGQGDNNNPFVSVGRDSISSQGTLLVSNGGKLVITGNAISTAAFQRATTLNIGGRSGSAATGTATVTGAGSEILMSGNDTLINVGRTDGSTGVLNVLAGAHVSATSMVIGAGTANAVAGPTKAQGTVNLNNATLVLSGGRADVGVGAGITVGRGVNGVGVMNLSNGAQLQLNPSGSATGGMSIGGDQFQAGGTGTLNLDSGSSIVFGGPLVGNGFSVGRSGTGTVNLAGASFIDVAAGDANLAGLPAAGQSTGSAQLHISGGSKLTANRVSIGGNSDVAGDLGGTATVTVSGAASELKASGANGFIGVGRAGTGTLTVDNQAKVGAIAMSVGRNGGTGTFNATNATIQLAGQQTTGNFAGASLSIGQTGGTGTVNLTGTGVTIHNATGSSGASLNIGGTTIYPGGTGTLQMANSTVDIAAGAGPAIVNVGRNGSGTAVLNASSISVGDGVATNGSVYVGREAGATGQLTLANGSTLNAGFVGVGVASAGAGNALGAAGGTGQLNISGNSAVHASRVEVGAGGAVNVGAGGTLNVSSLGSLNAAPVIDSSVYVARQAGSTGTLVLGSTTTPGATLQAGFVGIGVNGMAVNGVQSNGGAGSLVLNNSTLNTTHFELGAGSTLSGDGGVINAGAGGPVIIGGTISPGNSPGRIRINCDFTMLLGSQLILEIDDNGVNVDLDQLIIGEESNFDIKQAQIIFSFLGNTNPEAVDLNLNRFLRAGVTDSEDTRALQTLFGAGEDWNDVVDTAKFGFRSNAYDVTHFAFNAETGRIGDLQATSKVPEPATYALILLALGLMARQQRRSAARRG